MRFGCVERGGIVGEFMSPSSFHNAHFFPLRCGCFWVQRIGLTNVNKRNKNIVDLDNGKAFLAFVIFV